VVGLVLLGAGGVLFYLNSAAVAEPPPAVGVIEPPVLSEAEAPVLSSVEPPVLSEAEALVASQAEAPVVSSVEPPVPSEAEVPVPSEVEVPVVSSVEPPVPSEAEVPVVSSVEAPVPSEAEATSPPSLDENPLPVVAEAGLADESAPVQGQAADEVVRQAEADAPSGPPPAPDPAAASAPAAANPPARVVIPAIDLDAEVIPVGWEKILQDGKLASVWQVAEYAAGWHENSALPGAGGNVVLSGHHNVKGEVFRYIVDLEVGDSITLYADERPYTYTVESRFVVRDKGMSEEQRRENARWIGAFPDERLTLVTCWPYTSNTHRVIVVAKPAEPSAK
jgi:sortase A